MSAEAAAAGIYLYNTTWRARERVSSLADIPKHTRDSRVYILLENVSFFFLVLIHSVALLLFFFFCILLYKSSARGVKKRNARALRCVAPRPRARRKSESESERGEASQL